jgi:hypothetical protein
VAWGVDGSLAGSKFGRLDRFEFRDAVENDVLEFIDGNRVAVGSYGPLKVFEKLAQILDGLALGAKSHNLNPVDARRGLQEI